MTTKATDYTFLVEWNVGGTYYLQHHIVLAATDPDTATDQALEELTGAEIWDGRTLYRLSRVPTSAIENVPVERLNIPRYRRA